MAGRTTIFNKITLIFNCLSPNVTYFTGKGESIGDNGMTNIFPENWILKRGFLSSKGYSRLQTNILSMIKHWNNGKIVNITMTNYGFKYKVYDGTRFILKDKLVFVESNWIQNIFLSIKFKKLILK